MEKNHKYGFRKHKAVKGLGVALLGTVGVLAGSSLVSANEVGISEAVQTNRTIDATISRVDYNELSEEQKAHIKSGMIDEQLSWINPETGNFEWITGFVAVYKSTGDCQVIPLDPVPIDPNVSIPPTPGSNIPVLPLTPNNQPVSKVTGIPRKSNLPKTGLVGSKTIAVAGLGLLTFGGYLLFKNRKTGKHVAIALLVAGGVGVSSPVLANSTTFLDLVENVTLQLNSRFTHTPESDPCWEYIGYYPEIASVPAETPTSPNTLTSADLLSESQETKGKVTVHYVDEEGNTIADSQELVNAVVSTTYRTKVTINGVEKVIENTVPTEVDYDTSALKVNTILFNGATYEYVSVKGSETGKVVAGETEVTYVYRKVTQPVVTREELDPIQETGKVTVHYVDEAGNKLADSKELVNAIISTTFRTKVTTNGVEEIKENKVVSDATYNAASVKATSLAYNGETYEFVAVQGSETGKVVAGETEVTYVYRKVTQPVVTREELDPIQETGKVTVHYVDEAGNKLADSKELVNAIISTTFRTKVTTNGVEEIKENKVVSDATYNAASVKATSLAYNGETYEFVAVQGTEAGKVVAGETDVTYVYRKVTQPVVTREELEPIQETGKVTVHYVDEAGNKLADSKELVNAIISTTFRTKVTTNGVEEIKENKVVSDATYNAASVKATSLAYNGATYEFVAAQGTETGKVVAGETEVTYVYRKVTQPVVTREELDPIQETGKVTVHYVDEAGNKLADSKELVNAIISTTFRTKVTTNGVEEIKENKVVSDATYNAASVKATSLEYNGETYEYVSVEGTETGKVVAGETEVTYVYRKVTQPVVTREELDPIQETGKVTVHYVDEAGNKLADSKELVNAIISTTFRTKVTTDGVEEIKENKVVSDATYNAAAVKATSLEYNGETYEYVSVTGNETGKVVAGETEVTYVYRKVTQPVVTRRELEPLLETGTVNVHFVDEAGVTIAPSKVLVNTIVSFTEQTETITDGISNIEKTKRETNASYDASNLRPDRIEFEGALYEYTSVNGAVSGKVLPGENHVTYIYRKVPNTTEVTTREIKGKVITRYVDESTGQDILTGSTVADGVVAIETTTTTKDYKGNIIDTKVTTEPTDLQYDTTADRDLNNSRIDTMRVAPLEAHNELTGLTSPIENGKATAVAETLNVYIPLTDPQLDGKFLSDRYASERGFDTTTAQLVESEAVISDRDPLSISNIVTQEGVVTPWLTIANGQVYYVQHFVYTKPVDLEENPVPYAFTRVDTAETGTVEEGETVVTYYYKRVSLSVTPQSDSINIIRYVQN